MTEFTKEKIEQQRRERFNRFLDGITATGLGFWWAATRGFVWRWRLGYWDWEAWRAAWRCK